MQVWCSDKIQICYLLAGCHTFWITIIVQLHHNVFVYLPARSWCVLASSLKLVSHFREQKNWWFSSQQEMLQLLHWERIWLDTTHILKNMIIELCAHTVLCTLICVWMMSVTYMKRLTSLLATIIILFLILNYDWLSWNLSCLGIDSSHYSKSKYVDSMQSCYASSLVLWTCHLQDSKFELCSLGSELRFKPNLSPFRNMANQAYMHTWAAQWLDWTKQSSYTLTCICTHICNAIFHRLFVCLYSASSWRDGSFLSYLVPTPSCHASRLLSINVDDQDKLIKQAHEQTSSHRLVLNFA